MARWSPQDPGFTPVPGVLDALSHIATSGATGYTDVKERGRADALAADELARAEEDRSLRLHELGARRGRAPMEAVPEEEDIFGGAEFGMQEPRGREAPPIFQGAQPGMAGQLQGALGQIQEQGAPPEPQVLALPGAYVEGMGFTPRLITDQDLVPQSRARAAVPRERAQPGFEQVTDDLYIDRSATPAGREEARETRRDREERERLEAALGALQGGSDDPAVQAAALEGGVPGSQVFPDEDEDTISLSGRDFPNTRAGEIAALAWQESVNEARATGSDTGSDSDARITGEVTRRTLATAAVRAMQQINDEIRELGASQGGTISDRQRRQLASLNRDRDDALRSFGFENVQELQEEMRALRLTGVGGAPEVGGGELSDADIDRLISQNPDMTDEEILELMERGAA